MNMQYTAWLGNLAEKGLLASSLSPTWRIYFHLKLQKKRIQRFRLESEILLLALSHPFSVSSYIYFLSAIAYGYLRLDFCTHSHTYIFEWMCVDKWIALDWNPSLLSHFFLFSFSPHIKKWYPQRKRISHFLWHLASLWMEVNFSFPYAQLVNVNKKETLLTFPLQLIPFLACSGTMKGLKLCYGNTEGPNFLVFNFHETHSYLIWIKIKTNTLKRFQGNSNKYGIGKWANKISFNM